MREQVAELTEERDEMERLQPGTRAGGDVGGVQQELSSESALAMARQWEPRRNPYSEQWQELVHAARSFLMELACFPDSKLSAEVELRLGQGSSMRVSH